METRNQETHLYQDQDPVEKQTLWVKSDKRGWTKSKVIKVIDKKSVSEGEEFILKMKEFHAKVITITKYPKKSIRPKQDLYGWTRCPTEEEQQVVDLWEEEFTNANNEEEHELNLYRNVFEKEIGVTTYGEEDDEQNIGYGKGNLEARNNKENKPKDDGAVNIEQGKSDIVTIENDDPSLSSLASGTSEFNNIEYLMYVSTYIGGNYIRDGVLSITNKSEDKQLICKSDDWLDLLQMEQKIIHMTDSIIHQIAEDKN